MKKTLGLLITLIAITTSLFASGTKEQSMSSDSKDVTLTVYARAYTYNQNAPWKVAEQKIQEAHPDINFTFEYEGFGWSDLRTKFLTASAGGNAPDVVQADIIWLGEYANNDLICDVTEKAEAWDKWGDVVETYKEATKVNGKIYGTWLNTDVRVMVYNKKLFKAAGLDPNAPPETWSELNEIAAKISTPPNYYGIGFPATMEDESAQTFYAGLFSLGGEILNSSNTKAAFNSPEGVASLTQLVNLVNYGAAPSSIVSGSASDINNGVFQDTFAMSYMTKAYGLAKKLIPDLTIEQYQKDFGVASIPRADNGEFSTMSGGYLLSVPTGSTNKDFAWEFITYAGGPEAQFGYTAARGYVPTFKSLMARADDYYEIDPFFSVILNQLPNAHFRPSIPQYTEVAAEIQTAIQAAVMGVKTPKVALDNAALAVNAILED
jgi:multiple sugar transport system substrate-binding protein